MSDYTSILNSDPNTTKLGYIFTSHPNSPGDDYFWHITTTTHPSKEGYRSQTANRSGESTMYIRSFDGKWSDWSLLSSSGNVEDIVSDKINDYDDYINNKFDTIEVEFADIDKLLAKKASITDLEVVRIEAESATIGVADLGVLVAQKASVGQLNAAIGNINELYSNYADISYLLAGNLTANNFQAGAITAESGLIANGAILNSMIVNLDVSKLNAGDISTTKFRVLSDSGNLRIEDNSFKIWDNSGMERVSLGKNGNDYNLLVRSVDGETVLFGNDGVTHAGITDGAIDDSKVSDNANISGDKLNINSVLFNINERGETTIDSTKVNVGDQILNIAFGSLVNRVEDGEESVSNLLTDFTIQQGEVSSLITDMSIIDGKVDSTEQLVSSFQQDLLGFKTTVSQTYTTKSELESAKSDLTSAQQSAKTALEAYALAQAEAERIKAEAYADGKITAEERERINQALADRQAAKEYSELKASEAKDLANDYTDGKIEIVDGKYTEFRQDFDGFTFIVDSTYATKKELDEKIVYSYDEPANPKDGQLWVNTSVTPNDLFIYSEDTEDWVYIGNDLSLLEGDLGELRSNLENLSTSVDEKANKSDVVNLETDIEDKMGQLEVSIGSKASLTSVEDLQVNYNERLEQIDLEKQEVVDNLTDLVERTIGMEIIMGDKMALWDFIDKQITFSEEGMHISSLTGDMGILVSEDRISFIDKGTEVAFISGQIMQINHGIFVESATIGIHKFEPIDDKVTIVNYVGGDN